VDVDSPHAAAADDDFATPPPGRHRRRCLLLAPDKHDAGLLLISTHRLPSRRLIRSPPPTETTTTRTDDSIALKAQISQRSQTCFLCEIYCPTDALYVAPDAEGPSAVTEAEIEAAGLFGSYARGLGWRRGRPGGADNDPTFRLRDAAQ
jgi:hypothetical protein